MSRTKFFISLLLMLYTYNYVIAQDIRVDTATYEKGGENTYENNYNEYLPDTALYFTNKYVLPDSIDAYKHSKDFAYAKNLDSLLKSLIKKEDNVEFHYKPEKKSWLERFFDSDITQYAFWTLAVLFILLVLYKLFFTKGFFQRTTIKNSVVELNDEEEMSMDSDYEKMIRQAITEKNYRMAVRYMYLQSLQKLAGIGAINFSANKTNYQYIREVSGKAYKNIFAKLTLHYEYAWYGGFEVDELSFNKLQTEFKQFYSQL